MFETSILFSVILFRLNFFAAGDKNEQLDVELCKKRVFMDRLLKRVKWLTDIFSICNLAQVRYFCVYICAQLTLNGYIQSVL